MPLLKKCASRKDDASKQPPCSRVEMKELGMTRARIANAEALVKHISERIRTDNKTAFDRSGLPQELLRFSRETPLNGVMTKDQGSPSKVLSRFTPHKSDGFHHPAKPVINFGEPDPGEAGVVDQHPNESYEVVSSYLQQIVRDLMDQMTGPSSAQHYDRHVLLVDEMLRRDAIYGFTPSMVLAGVGDIMCLLADALLAGKFLVPPHPTHGYSKAKAHRAAIAAAVGPSAATKADRIDLAVPTLGVEGYLPAHIKKPVSSDHRGQDGVFGDGSVPRANPSLEAKSLTGSVLDPIRQRSPDSKIVTVQDALYALIQHCSRPLVCITMNDQRNLAPAVEQLCSVLSRISSEVVSDEPQKGPLSPSFVDSFSGLHTLQGPTDNHLSLTAEEPVGEFPDEAASPPMTAKVFGNSFTIEETSSGLHLGGLTLKQHQGMTRAIRLAALHAIEAVLAVYDRHIDTIELTKEKERAVAPLTESVGKGGKKKKGVVDRLHTDTVTTAILNSLDLHRSEISHLLVERWSSILRNAQPVDCGEDGPNQAPLLDSARNVNPFTAKDAYDGKEADSEEAEDEEEAITGILLKTATTNSGTKSDTFGTAEFSSKSIASEDFKNRPRGTSSCTFCQDDSRFRGVLTMAEEEEIAAILHIFVQLFSLSEYTMDNLHSHISTKASSGNKEATIGTDFDVPVHPQVPILAARTLARCAVGDYCASLCMDLLWQLITGAPNMTSRSILYDTQELPKDTMPTNSLFETAATENLFQSLVNFLNTSHRALQREMRNDVVILLTAILRTNTKAMGSVPLDSSVPQTELQLPIPLSTIDAISAISLVLFDLLCRPELSVDYPGKLDVSCFVDLDPDGYWQSANGPCLSFVSKQTLLQSSIRFHGVACPTLRKDNLQLKRLGWEFLESFCEWQATHMSYEGKVIDLLHQESQRMKSLGSIQDITKEPGDADCALYASDPATGANNAAEKRREEENASSEFLKLRRDTYDNYNLVDLCHLGFLDVLLMYCSVHCKNSIVLDWSKEELITLQEESWLLLGALVRSAEENRQRYGVTSMRQGDIDEVRSRLVSSHPGRGNSACSGLGVRNDTHQEGDAVQQAPAASKKFQQYFAADVYFIALDGVSTALTYATEAPSSVEHLKFSAIHLLSSISRSSDPAVQKTLAYASPVMVPLLTDLLRSLLSQMKSGFGTQYKRIKNHIRDGEKVMENVPCSTIPLPESVNTLVLSSFTLLINIGAAAKQWMNITQCVEKCDQMKANFQMNSNVSSSQSNNLRDPTAWLSRSGSFISSTGKRVSIHHPDSASSSEMKGVSPEIPSAAWHFQRCGGIKLLVAWAEYILFPNMAKQQSIFIQALAKNPGSRDSARPPIVEQELYDNIDLLVVLFSCIRTLVLGVPPSESSLMDENGVGALLSVIEALAIAADALPSDRTSNVTCILRDTSVTTTVPLGLRTTENIRKEVFTGVLKYGLVVLSDLLLSCKAAAQYFFGWHSHFLLKAHEVGFGAPHHLDPRNNYLNATQLLLAMWIKATGKRSEGDPFFFNSQAPEHDQNLVIGMRVLNTNLRTTALVSLRREYARRLLRRRVEERIKEAKAKGNSSEATTSISELVNYYYYIFGSQVTNLSDEEIALRMRELISTDESNAHRIHERLITDAICQPLGLAVKVFSCLTAIGFDALVDVPISPAERSHLIGAAAFPALCTDELCVSMAEVARINEDLPWGESGDNGSSRSFIEAGSFCMDEVVVMRPTTPDRRCLCTLMDDVQSRSHELSQLFELGTDSEKTQLRELYNRFLITRLKQPVGVASLWEEYNDRNGTCSTLAFEQMDAAAIDQEQQGIEMQSPDFTSEASTALSPHGSASPLGNRSTPAKLAKYVSRKVEHDQEEDTLLACQRSYPGELYRPNQGGNLRVMSPVNEDGVQEEVPLTSTPSAMSHNIAVYNHYGGEVLSPVPKEVRGGNQDHATAIPAAGDSEPERRPVEQPTLEVENLLANSHPDGTRKSHKHHLHGNTVDLQVTWPTRPKSSLAEKHLKKDRMIRNSLRAVGGVTVQRDTPAQAVDTSVPAMEEADTLDVKNLAEILVDRVIAYAEYAEPQPAHIFPLEPEDDIVKSDESES